MVGLVPPLTARSATGSARRLAGVFVLACALLSGCGYHLVGRGSLFHAADTLGPGAGGLNLQLFPADMGFLLAMLPPGAFIAFGLLLAARNWIRHESGQNR